jgi:arginase
VAARSDAVRAVVSRSCGEIYLHVDVDVVDSEDLPGLKFPAGAGPSFSVVEECLAHIVDAVPPIAASISCAWTPDRIGDESTRVAIERLAAVIGAELEWSVEGAGSGRDRR